MSSIAFAAPCAAPAPATRVAVAGLARASGAALCRGRSTADGRQMAAAFAVAATVVAGARQAPRRRTTRGSTARRVVATDAPTQKATESKSAWKKYDLKWGVHKFGGASLDDAKLYKICGDLLLSESKNQGDAPTAAIVSAAGGMTDALVSIIDTALTSVDESCEKLKAAADRQKSILLELVPDNSDLTDQVISNIDEDQQAVKAMLLAASKMRGVPPQMLELVAGLGEVWSAQTLAAYLKTTGKLCEWIDARDVLIVPDGPLSGLREKGTAMDTIEPFWDESQDRLQKWWQKSLGDKDPKEPPFLIITGFVCSTMAGRPTTLKRSGSDYSATIFAKILDASNVTFWKNVSGVFTADPRQVPEAFPIGSMTFDEAMELAYFGGQVLHPSAMVPCIEERIPVLVKNVFKPADPGTRVYGRGDASFRWEDQDDEIDVNMPVKAITSIEKVSLLTIAGASFMGTHGVAERFMDSLAKVGVNVILTSQGSSEHSITVAVANTDGKLALNAVKDAFQLEIARNTETRATLKEDLSILAVIGEGMKNYAGISGRFFNALGQSKVNIVAIAQGSSERNISAVVSREELSLALKATHDAFLLKETCVSVSLLGSGQVGSAFLQKLSAWEANEGRDFALPSMREVQYLSIDLRVLCDANQMLCAPRGLPVTQLEKHINNGSLDLAAMAASWEKEGKEVKDVLHQDVTLQPSNLDSFIEMTECKEYPRKIIVDCTDSDAVASRYPDWLKQGFHVITPNRQVLTGSYERYAECLKYVGHAGKFGGAQLRYDAAVGGQIPIITLLQDQIQTGDRIDRLTGVLSGTLSLVFNQLNTHPDMLFSEAFKLAQERELTNADPIEDLSGLDTAEKSLILARELGVTVELADVEIESLVPKGSKTDDIIQMLKDEVDEPMAEKFREAREKGELLYYVGEIDVQKGKVSAGIHRFSAKGPPFALNDADFAASLLRVCRALV